MDNKVKWQVVDIIVKICSENFANMVIFISMWNYISRWRGIFVFLAESGTKRR